MTQKALLRQTFIGHENSGGKFEVFTHGHTNLNIAVHKAYDDYLDRLSLNCGRGRGRLSCAPDTKCADFQQKVSMNIFFLKIGILSLSRSLCSTSISKFLCVCVFYYDMLWVKIRKCTERFRIKFMMRPIMIEEEGGIVKI